MPLMDKWGRIKIFKWRINIIDFIAILFLLCVAPVGYFAYKVSTKPAIIVPIPEPTHYAISRGCPNCRTPKKKDIPFGEPIPLEWKDKCIDCGNEGWYIKKPTPRPEFELVPEEVDWEQFFYEHSSKERGWVE